MDDLRIAKDDPTWNRGESANVYSLPVAISVDSLSVEKLTVGIPKNQIKKVGMLLTAQSPDSHIGPYKWAIDFLVPDDTLVLAAKEGQIVEAIDDFNTWGITADFRDKLNYITIQHDKGEYSRYCHLAQYSFRNTKLKVGDKISKGEVIARVGKTGWTDRDHLHFIVFKIEQSSKNPFGFYSLKIRFEK